MPLAPDADDGHAVGGGPGGFDPLLRGLRLGAVLHRRRVDPARPRGKAGLGGWGGGGRDGEMRLARGAARMAPDEVARGCAGGASGAARGPGAVSPAARPWQAPGRAAAGGDGDAGRGPAHARHRPASLGRTCRGPGRIRRTEGGTMKKWAIWMVALGLVASACSSGGGSKGKSNGQSSSPGGKIKEGGTLRIGTNSRIDSLNPFVAFNQDAYTTFFYIYPYLVQYDTKTLQFAPYYSTTWETSSDGKDWTFHLVPNAKWSDGQPLTADDVAWTVNTILKVAK